MDSENIDAMQAGLTKAAEWIHSAEALLICAGAGMGVDSGLPDFRGDQGLWHHYPALGRRKLGFVDIATPAAFIVNPELAWGFYGHRLQLYRQTVPHAGFALLRQWSQRCRQGGFVFTSNVDGQFQKAGFNESHVVECHGSLHYLQCINNCQRKIWPSDFTPDIDGDSCYMTSPLPTCPWCDGLARPNILMFNDSDWQSTRTDTQYEHLNLWKERVKGLLVIELGAGTAIPTVRHMAVRQQARLIRINPKDSGIDSTSQVSLKMSASEALGSLNNLL